MNYTENHKLIDDAIQFIAQMTDTDTIDEQLDCIEALRKLRIAYKQKHPQH